MREQALLRRLVIIRCDDEDRVGARLFGVLGQTDRFQRIVGAGAGNDRYAPAGRLDAEFDDAAMLGMRERRGFAGGADRNETVAPFGDLPLDVVDEGLLVDGARFGEGGDEGGNGSLEHRRSPDGGLRVSNSRFGRIPGLENRGTIIARRRPGK